MDFGWSSWLDQPGWNSFRKANRVIAKFATNANAGSSGASPFRNHCAATANPIPIAGQPRHAQRTIPLVITMMKATLVLT
jgi:hypothetical protein